MAHLFRISSAFIITVGLALSLIITSKFLMYFLAAVCFAVVIQALFTLKTSTTGASLLAIVPPAVIGLLILLLTKK
jgi:hypothetical protein